MVRSRMTLTRHPLLFRSISDAVYAGRCRGQRPFDSSLWTQTRARLIGWCATRSRRRRHHTLVWMCTCMTCACTPLDAMNGVSAGGATSPYWAETTMRDTATGIYYWLAVQAQGSGAAERRYSRTAHNCVRTGHAVWDELAHALERCAYSERRRRASPGRPCFVHHVWAFSGVFSDTFSFVLLACQCVQALVGFSTV